MRTLFFVAAAAAAAAPPAALSTVTSTFRRARKSRDLRVEEVQSCAHVFTTFQNPTDDYFRGAACSDQVHVTLASSTSAFVSFVTPTAEVRSEVRFWR